LIKTKNKALEAQRYLAFYVLAFALMGRNVKAIYFNDLLGLPNDYKRARATGELRDIKRTKVNIMDLKRVLSSKSSFEYKIVSEMNKLIYLFDRAPSFHFRGSESRVVLISKNIVCICNSYKDNFSFVVINVSSRKQKVKINFDDFEVDISKVLYENIGNKKVSIKNKEINLIFKPFQYYWFTNSKIKK
jgi:hypothetical protein